MGNTDGHLNYKNFEAWIAVDNKPLPVFGVDYKEGTREATAWIPSEAGKAFSVCYRKLPRPTARTHDFNADILLDGHKVSARIHSRRRTGYLAVKTISFLELSATETRGFVFNSVELTDDDAFLQDPTVAHVGEIRVILQFAQRLGDSSNHAYRVCPETRKIHERSKKGFVHQIKYSESKTRSPSFPRNGTHTKAIGEPVTFIFKYRPLAMLQAQGVAPRPLLPHAATAAEEDDIAARERALLAELEIIRKQKRAMDADEGERPIKRIKTEPIEQFRPAEVIDLTVEFDDGVQNTSEEVIDLT